MPTLDEVRPGDVITSDLWNTLRQLLADHEQRISDLEGSGGGGGEPNPQGRFDLEFLSVSPATIVAGSPATFRYRLSSRASASVAVTLVATVDTAANRNQWQARVRILDSNLNQIPRATLDLPAGQSRIFHVQITSVPNVAEGTEFTLSATARGGGLVNSSPASTFTVGEEAEPQDETIELLPPTPGDVQFIGSGSFDGTTLSLAAGASALLPFLGRFSLPGTYEVVEPAAVGNGWTATRQSGSTPPRFVIGEVGDGPVQRSVNYVVGAGSAAASEGRVVLALQRAGASNARSVELVLNRL